MGEIVNMKDFDVTLSSLPASDPSTCFEKLRSCRAGTGYNRSTAGAMAIFFRSSSLKVSQERWLGYTSTEIHSARSANLLAAKMMSRSLSLKLLPSSAPYVDTRPYVDGGGPDAHRRFGLIEWPASFTMSSSGRPSASSAAALDGLGLQHRSDVSLLNMYINRCIVPRSSN